MKKLKDLQNTGDLDLALDWADIDLRSGLDYIYRAKNLLSASEILYHNIHKLEHIKLEEDVNNAIDRVEVGLKQLKYVLLKVRSIPEYHEKLLQLKKLEKKI